MNPVELAEYFIDLMKRADAPIETYQTNAAGDGGGFIDVLTSREGLERLAEQHESKKGIRVMTYFPKASSDVDWEVPPSIALDLIVGMSGVPNYFKITLLKEKQHVRIEVYARRGHEGLEDIRA